MSRSLLVMSGVMVVLAALLAIAGGIGLLLGYQDPTGDVVLTVAVGAAVVGVVFRLMAWVAELHAYRVEHERPKHEQAIPKDHLFCTDCGKKYVMRQSQRGFDPKTGVPIFSYMLGCPDGRPDKTTEAYDRYLSYPSPFAPLFSGQKYRWPDCGDTKVVAMLPVSHLHSSEETRADCPACVEQMLSDGVIDLPGARKLLGKVS